MDFLNQPFANLIPGVTVWQAFVAYLAYAFISGVLRAAWKDWRR